MELTILMPCLNEEKTIGECIDPAFSFLNREKIEGEVLIADNGSEDASAAIAKGHGARVVCCRNRGYGNALLCGFTEAKGTYIIMGDCDESYDFSSLDGFLKALREGYDLVMGNRMNGTMEKGAMPFSHRYIGVPILSWLGRVRYRTKIGDFHCGLRGFPREKILELNLKSGGMELASEMIGAAVKERYSICEIPITLHKDGRDGSSHLHTIRDGFRHLWLLLFGTKR